MDITLRHSRRDLPVLAPALRREYLTRPKELTFLGRRFAREFAGQTEKYTWEYAEPPYVATLLAVPQE